MWSAAFCAADAAVTTMRKAELRVGLRKDYGLPARREPLLEKEEEQEPEKNV